MEVSRGNTIIVPVREYRKGNWTLEETLVLIEAKQLEAQRRMIKNNSSGELRWKWIEEHCWIKGCFRSQNQCNDKWDNMMRDFKKVREFERSRKCHHHDDDADDEHHNNSSYWNLDKIQRKNNNLPSNMLPQVFQALAHVMEAKLGGSVHPTVIIHRDTAAHPPLPPPPPPDDAPLPWPTQESSSKRRKSTEGRSISDEISSSTSVLIEAIKGYEEKEETRHRELYSVHQRMYKVEESKIVTERQGFNELVDVINNLSSSILALTSQRTHL